MDTQLELQALPHPDPKVRRFGFDLTDPYVEQCWGAVVGPSGIATLRRLPVLWTHQESAHMPPDELARTLGLGPGTGLRGRFNRALGDSPSSASPNGSSTAQSSGSTPRSARSATGRCRGSRNGPGGGARTAAG